MRVRISPRVPKRKKKGELQQMGTDTQALYIFDWLHIVVDRFETMSDEEKIGYGLALKDLAPIAVAFDIPIEKINKALGVPR